MSSAELPQVNPTREPDNPFSTWFDDNPRRAPVTDQAPASPPTRATPTPADPRRQANPTNEPETRFSTWLDDNPRRSRVSGEARVAPPTPAEPRRQANPTSEPDDTRFSSWLDIEQRRPFYGDKIVGTTPPETRNSQWFRQTPVTDQPTNFLTAERDPRVTEPQATPKTRFRDIFPYPTVSSAAGATPAPEQPRSFRQTQRPIQARQPTRTSDAFQPQRTTSSAAEQRHSGSPTPQAPTTPQQASPSPPFWRQRVQSAPSPAWQTTPRQPPAQRFRQPTPAESGEEAAPTGRFGERVKDMEMSLWRQPDVEQVMELREEQHGGHRNALASLAPQFSDSGSALFRDTMESGDGQAERSKLAGERDQSRLQRQQQYNGWLQQRQHVTDQPQSRQPTGDRLQHRQPIGERPQARLQSGDQLQPRQQTGNRLQQSAYLSSQIAASGRRQDVYDSAEKPESYAEPTSRSQPVYFPQYAPPTPHHSYPTTSNDANINLTTRPLDPELTYDEPEYYAKPYQSYYPEHGAIASYAAIEQKLVIDQPNQHAPAGAALTVTSQQAVPTRSFQGPFEPEIRQPEINRSVPRPTEASLLRDVRDDASRTDEAIKAPAVETRAAPRPGQTAASVRREPESPSPLPPLPDNYFLLANDPAMLKHLVNASRSYLQQRVDAELRNSEDGAGADSSNSDKPQLFFTFSERASSAQVERYYRTTSVRPQPDYQSQLVSRKPQPDHQPQAVAQNPYYQTKSELDEPDHRFAYTEQPQAAVSESKPSVQTVRVRFDMTEPDEARDYRTSTNPAGGKLASISSNKVYFKPSSSSRQTSPTQTNPLKPSTRPAQTTLQPIIRSNQAPNPAPSSNQPANGRQNPIATSRSNQAQPPSRATAQPFQASDAMTFTSKSIPFKPSKLIAETRPTTTSKPYVKPTTYKPSSPTLTTKNKAPGLSPRYWTVTDPRF